MTGTTRGSKDTAGPAVLHVAFELDDLRWTLTMATGMGKRPRQRRVSPRDREAVLCEVEETKRRFGLAPGTHVVSCYEAGREGFWLHRWLESEGVENRVVDSASIEVNRRKRRVKADRLDGRKLLRLLIRHQSGESGVWSVVRVPSVEAEDARHLHRELTALKRDLVRVTNRIKGLVAGRECAWKYGTIYPSGSSRFGCGTARACRPACELDWSKPGSSGHGSAIAERSVGWPVSHRRAIRVGPRSRPKTDRKDRRPEERPDGLPLGPLNTGPQSRWGPLLQPGFDRRFAADAAFGDRTAQPWRAGTHRRSSEAPKGSPTLHTGSHRSKGTERIRRTPLIRNKPVCRVPPALADAAS